ncbi:MAG TPA: hypothetical protein DCX07_12760 [Phycisphaerales bacterium]|nr:hypothetical protein [Phycisphaerales bacterium]
MPASDATNRAVVFDLDDTLYPERQYVRSGYVAVAKFLRVETGRGEKYEDWLWRRFLEGETGGAFDSLNEAFSLGLCPDRIGQLVRVYRGHHPDIRPYEGVAGLLDRLRGRVRLGLLSDGFLPAQQLKLDALGLADRFDAVLFTETMGRECWKPSPAGFVALAEKLHVPAAGCAYVADNPAKDFLAPNRLGWRTIQLRMPGQVHADRSAEPGGQAQRVVAGLGDLETALGE